MGRQGSSSLFSSSQQKDPQDLLVLRTLGIAEDGTKIHARRMSLVWLLLAGLTLHAPPTRLGLLREAKRAHAAELTSPTATTFLNEETFPHDCKRPDFNTHEIDARFAGPDANTLGKASCSVHVSKQAVLTFTECLALRLEARIAMVWGFSAAFTYTDLVEIGVVKVSDLPIARRLLRHKLASSLLPLVAERFALDASSLRVRDAVVLRYDAAQRATRQPMHRDDALISFSVPLSAQLEYSGGGTCFEGSGAVLRPQAGRLLCHASGIRHAGNDISHGVRWMLVVFLVATHVPQLSRRCQNIADSSVQLAAEAEAVGDKHRAAAERETANAALSTAISLAPADFQLHHDLGLFLMDAGDAMSARRSFQRAASLYPLCPRPHLALALLLSESGRHRAALRHYESARAAVEQHGGGQDRIILLDVAVGATRCLLALRELYHSSVERRLRMAVAPLIQAERMEEMAGRLRIALAKIDRIENEMTSEAQQVLDEIEAARFCIQTAASAEQGSFLGGATAAETGQNACIAPPAEITE